MLVTLTKLQRQISYHGIDDATKLSVDTAAALKRLNRNSREADSVTNLIGVLKSELDKIPTSELDAVRLEIKPDVAKAWLTALALYARRVSRVEKAAQQIEMQTGANTLEDAAEKIANQLQEQLDLPLQSLESIISEQDERERKEKEADKKFAEGLQPAPHRGTDQPDEGLAPGGPAADSRNRRGPKRSPIQIVKGRATRKGDDASPA
jgi:hypothetical protein